MRLVLVGLMVAAFGSEARAASQLVTLPGHVPPVVSTLTPKGTLPAETNLQLAIGLPLRNEAALDDLISQLYDPNSTNFHRFLTCEEFTARFGPTEQDYEALTKFAEDHGLTVVGTHPNRVVLDVRGTAANVGKAFNVTLRTYRHPTEGRNFFAPDVDPSVPANLSVRDMWGLSDYSLPQPLVRRADPSKISPLNYNGSGTNGNYQGSDFRNAYVPGTSLNGSGQIAAVAEFDGYYASDIANYETLVGYPAVPLQNVIIDSVSGLPGYSGLANAVLEVSLDIEMIIDMAPGLTKLIVYEGASPYDVFNKIVTDNSAKQISCSWSWGFGPTHTWVHRNSSSTLDSQLKQMVTQGQSFFQASGDSCAYTAGQAFSSSSGPIPQDSIYVTCVGGTSLNMNSPGASYVSESVWNWGGNQGSGGGVSQNYTIPSWQASVSMALNSGSPSFRNIPDVALTADGVLVIGGHTTNTFIGGTSCAAPLWAGFCALANQQAAAVGGATNVVGFLNPAIYPIAAGANYNNCFHDITSGNNIGSGTPGLYNAVSGYDLATGLGTPNGINLINALAPPRSPIFTAQPVSQTVTSGTSVAFSATVSGAAPITYKWLLNGGTISAGNVTGTSSNVLSVTSATTNNAGNYTLVATNSSGSATSSVAVLTVGFAPAFSAQPTNLTVLSGSNAVFTVVAGGSTPLAYQWRKNGANLSNGSGISGATTSSLTLSGVTTNSNGSYTAVVTNLFGTATSSAATLTVVFAPSIAGALSNQTVECGGNASYSVTASGTTPLHLQWSLDGSAVAGATNSSFSLTSVHLPSHTIGVVVTNLYGSLSSNVVLTVHDTTPPAITLNGSNPMTLELGSAFVDPGATATDVCAGAVAVITSGTVNTNGVGTNTIHYTATDGNGNTNTVARIVIVHDTTPPTIERSFTNLVLAAGSNCTASMPDVTGTNYILATDLSGTVTVSESPTNGTPLPLGTNVVILTAKDPSGNSAFSTNTIVVADETAPAITGQPHNATNTVGTTATFTVGATACTPISYQWFFNSSGLLANQTNATLTIGSVNPANAGGYFARVVSAGGSSTSSVATLTVDLIATGVTLSSSNNPSGFKDNLDFIASLTPSNAAGTVEFLTNGVAFDSEAVDLGVATSVVTASLPRGTNIVTGVYSGDSTHVPATNSLAQIVTNHPPTAVAAFYTRTAGAVLSIAVAALATNWSDVDGDTVSLAGVGVSTNGVTVANNGATLVYSNASNLADQFVCTITDGWGGTNFQTVNIAVVISSNAAPSITSITSNPNGSFSLNFKGAPGANYVLETTESFAAPVQWLPVATNVAGLDGTWQLIDGQAMNFQQRFYRLKLAP